MQKKENRLTLREIATEHVLRSLVVDEGEAFFVSEVLEREDARNPNMTKLVFKKQSQGDYIFLIPPGRRGEINMKRNILLEEGASLREYYFYFGASKVSLQYRCEIRSKARLERVSLFLFTASQRAGVEEEFFFSEPFGFGRFETKGILADESVVHYDGNIVIAPKAQQVDSRLGVHSFLLGEKSESRMIPRLQIEANNVSAGHAATTTRIDDEKLFYLRSRGLSKKQALQLFIDGIFLQACDPFKGKEIYHTLLDSVQQKLQSLL